MKRFLKHVLVVFFASLMVVGCEKQEYIVEENTNSTSIRKENFRMFEELPSLIQKVTKSGVNYRSDSGLYDFTVLESDVLQISNEYGAWYTLKIVRDDTILLLLKTLL